MNWYQFNLFNRKNLISVGVQTTSIMAFMIHVVKTFEFFSPMKNLKMTIDLLHHFLLFLHFFFFCLFLFIFFSTLSFFFRSSFILRGPVGPFARRVSGTRNLRKCFWHTISASWKDGIGLQHWYADAFERWCDFNALLNEKKVQFDSF